MKHTLSLFTFLFIPLFAFSAGVEIGGIHYVLDRSKLTASVTYKVWPKVSGGTDPISSTDLLYTGEVVIPNAVSYRDSVFQVTSIGDNAFFGSKRMTSVTIPNSITKIGYMAFAWCSGLKELTFPEYVTSVGAYMFTGDMKYVNFSCMALAPPVVQYNDLGVPLTVHVPYDAIPKYQRAYGWALQSIKSIMFESERLTDGSVNLAWMPVAKADLYQVYFEAYMGDSLALTDTLRIAADSQHGGVMTGVSSAQSRRHLPADEIGSVVIITIDPSSGAVAGQPFVVNVKPGQEGVITCRAKLFACNNGLVLKRDQMSFSLNDDTAIHDIISIQSYFDDPQSLCYDLSGNCFPISVWSSLSSGIYILSNRNGVKKVLK